MSEIDLIIAGCLGFFLGVGFGIVLMALMAAAGRDRHDE